MNADDINDVSWVHAVKYYLDDFGYLWMGPIPGNDEFRFKRFEGTLDNGWPNWVWRDSDQESDWEETTLSRAMKMIELFKIESRK